MIILSVLLFICFLPSLVFQLIIALSLLPLSFIVRSDMLFLAGYNLAIGLDQYVNVMFLGFPDETISGRVGRAVKTKREKLGVKTLQKTIDGFFLIFFNEKNHCFNSIETDENFGDKFEIFKLYKETE